MMRMMLRIVGVRDESGDRRVQVRMGLPDFRRKIADFIIFDP